MKRKVLKSMAACLLLCSFIFTPALADTIGGGVVETKNTGLNLRTAATTTAGCLTVIPSGSFVLVEEQLQGWYKVCYNGVEGYVSADYVSYKESLDGTYAFGGVTTSGTNVNMRADASTSSAKIKCINPAGSKLTVIGVKGAWLHVRDAAGAEGYIRSDFVHYQGQQTTADQVVATALQYEGYKYKWAGMSPETGFDCSGFVNYVYKQYDITMERTAQNIYNTNGTWVEKADLKPGDLVFFGWGSKNITHVGLYIGDGKFIHASTSSTGVIISELNSKYYTQVYVGAKRLIEA